MKLFRTEYKKINSKLISTAEYQREIKERKVKLIVENYNPNLVNAAKVSYRDGKYWVFDGQHTIAALKEMNGGDDILVDCKVFYGMTYQDEAILFSEQNGICTPVPNEAKLKSRYEGGDVQVIEFKEAVESCGLTCDFSKHNGNNRLVCYKVAYDIFARRNGEASLKEDLNLILDIWGGTPDALRREILGGLDVLIRDNGDSYDRKRMVLSLSRVNPTVILRNGKQWTRGGNRRFAKAMASVYNNGLKKIPPLKVKGEVF